MIGSIIVLWFALTRDLDLQGDWKIVTTASSKDQLTKYLWPEIHKWAYRIKWDVVGRNPFRDGQELLEWTLKLDRGEAISVASDKPDLVEGAHASHLFYLYDEAKAIPAVTFNATEGAFSNAGPGSRFEAKAVCMSTPGEPSGRFYEIQSKQPGYEDWTIRVVTLKECITAGQINAQWVLQRAKQWGRSSPLFLNQVRGQFASSSGDGVIPLAWIEDAIERWREWEAAGRILPKAPTIAVDVGGGGAEGDETVLAPAFGHIVPEIRHFDTGDEMATAGRAMQYQKRFGGSVRVDAIGIGSGVVSRLRELKCPVQAFKGSLKSRAKDRSGEIKFANLRTESFWHLRDLLNPQYNPDVCLPPDAQMIGDLTALHWRPMSEGKIIIEDKKEIRKRIGRSTNAGDAVAMALWESGKMYSTDQLTPISLTINSRWRK